MRFIEIKQKKIPRIFIRYILVASQSDHKVLTQSSARPVMISETLHVFVDAFIRGKSSQSASQKDRDLASVLLILHGSAVQVHQNGSPEQERQENGSSVLC